MDARLRAAATSSLRWYDDIFAAHHIPTIVRHGVWRALAQPPRWHSAAKTTEPTDVRAEALRAVEALEHCSVADTFAVLDLADSGFGVLFEATWVHHPPMDDDGGGWPAAWNVISSEEELQPWNRAHDTGDVLLPSLLGHPRLRFLREEVDGRLVGGAVLHDAGGNTVGLSNLWAVPGRRLDPEALLACAGLVYPGRAVVGYESGPTLETLLDAGFTGHGPQRVWTR